jgi:hypothetical protein
MSQVCRKFGVELSTRIKFRPSKVRQDINWGKFSMTVLQKAAVAAATALISLASTVASANGGRHHHWYPWFGHHVDKLPTFLAEVPEAPAIDTFSPGNLWVGNGIPATNMILR